MSQAADPARDPGLQAQRTVLAWHRTAFSLAANGLLILRAAYVGESGVVAVLGGTLLLMAAATYALGYWQRRTLLELGVQGALGSSALLALAITTFMACALGGSAMAWGHL